MLRLFSSVNGVTRVNLDSREGGYNGLPILFRLLLLHICTSLNYRVLPLLRPVDQNFFGVSERELHRASSLCRSSAGDRLGAVPGMLDVNDFHMKSTGAAWCYCLGGSFSIFSANHIALAVLNYNCSCDGGPYSSAFPGRCRGIRHGQKRFRWFSSP